ncbi:hypothetical protein CBE79_04780 [Priestia megaterium]|nr:hypothetical protein CBE78_02275 [Priestia megaterium]TPF22182.1 hypothetical protein CBE79_04780 [Priestia megaterium]
MQNQIVKNVEYIFNKYGNKIDSDKKLLLTYWKLVDKVEMDKENFSTTSFIELASNPSDILNARMLLEAINKE